jgi:hypothetical protein
MWGEVFTMKVSVRRWAVLTALPLALSAAEPCKLLTVEEITQAVGGSVSPSPLGSTGCFWKGSSQTVNITVRDASAWPRISAPGPGMTKTNASGIGDAAQYSALTGKDAAQTLSVKQGAKIIVLTVNGVKDAEKTRAVEASLAKLALGRL